MSHTFIFQVSMSCGGCSGAIDRVLKKTDGIESYEVSLETQTVKVVTSELTFEFVLGKIANTGKKVNSATVDGVERALA
ncbi:Metal homeostasis factor ATX1 [Escovopsis weberi]|uniref:Metal homeostasis factor ATX1 n=1 Tax=Escovopsis weberi TaxID=150374 RepID=A0A0M8MZ79_ESCWE|nr:Metal homeostasis factor ATX1 [Escovopsis weberi]